jgi:hypothetical protein
MRAQVRSSLLLTTLLALGCNPSEAPESAREVRAALSSTPQLFTTAVMGCVPTDWDCYWTYMYEVGAGASIYERYLGGLAQAGGFYKMTSKLTTVTLTYSNEEFLYPPPAGTCPAGSSSQPRTLDGRYAIRMTPQVGNTTFWSGSCGPRPGLPGIFALSCGLDCATPATDLGELAVVESPLPTALGGGVYNAGLYRAPASAPFAATISAHKEGFTTDKCGTPNGTDDELAGACETGIPRAPACTAMFGITWTAGFACAGGATSSASSGAGAGGASGAGGATSSASSGAGAGGAGGSGGATSSASSGAGAGGAGGSGNGGSASSGGGGAP